MYIIQRKRDPEKLTDYKDAYVMIEVLYKSVSFHVVTTKLAVGPGCDD